jgi:hypothetical protein
MPLYIEIQGREPSADFAHRNGRNASILSSWSSETTGETVRLVDAPDELVSQTAARPAMRILFY